MEDVIILGVNQLRLNDVNITFLHHTIFLFVGVIFQTLKIFFSENNFTIVDHPEEMRIMINRLDMTRQNKTNSRFLCVFAELCVCPVELHCNGFIGEEILQLYKQFDFDVSTSVIGLGFVKDIL